jgi:muramidase (phage lysozyme)
MSLEPLRALLRKYESADDYNAVWGGIARADHPPRPLVEMTVGQVLDWQDSIDRKYMSEAAGAYQILEDTLRGLYREADVPRSARYDRATQDKLADALLRRRGLDDYLAGRITAEKFALALSMEWASLPVPHDVRRDGRTIRKGQSYYAGDGLNAAHASVDEVLTALRAVKARARPEPVPKDPVTGVIDTALKEGVGKIGGGATGGAGLVWVWQNAPHWTQQAIWALGVALAALVAVALAVRLWRSLRKPSS